MLDWIQLLYNLLICSRADSLSDTARIMKWKRRCRCRLCVAPCQWTNSNVAFRENLRSHRRRRLVVSYTHTIALSKGCCLCGRYWEPDVDRSLQWGTVCLLRSRVSSISSRIADIALTPRRSSPSCELLGEHSASKCQSHEAEWLCAACAKSGPRGRKR